MTFIKTNKYLICLIMAIVGAALILPTISDYIDLFTNENISKEVRVHYGTILLSSVAIFLCHIIFVIIGRSRNIQKNTLMCAIILYYSSEIIRIGYDIFEYDSNDYFSIIIDALLMIITIMALYNPRFVLSAVVILLIDAAFNLSATFAGSTKALSELLLNVLLIGGIYFALNNDYSSQSYNYN